MDQHFHPDPIQEAVGQALHRAAQVASAAVAGAQALLYLRRTQNQLIATHDDLDSSLIRAQLIDDRAAASIYWTPALDPTWITQADLPATLRAWTAAMPYADATDLWHEPTASDAMRACEERLRDLHPYAMQRYDHLRSQGRMPADSMQEAAPFFSHSRALARGARSRPRPGERPWQQDFPQSIRDAVAGTARSEPTTGPRPTRPRRPGPTIARLGPMAVRTGGGNEYRLRRASGHARAGIAVLRQPASR